MFMRSSENSVNSSLDIWIPAGRSNICITWKSQRDRISCSWLDFHLSILPFWDLERRKAARLLCFPNIMDSLYKQIEFYRSPPWVFFFVYLFVCFNSCLLKKGWHGTALVPASWEQYAYNCFKRTTLVAKWLLFALKIFFSFDTMKCLLCKKD